MNIQTAQRVHEAIEDSSLNVFRAELYAAAVRYARIRTDWYLAAVDEKMEIDRTRTLAHNALIDACNILSRNMKNAGEDNGWRTLLGNDRNEIGDFACYLHAIFGVLSR